MFTYHPRGWLETITATPPAGAQNGPARLTTYQYDDEGQLERTILPDGSELIYDFDAAHELRSITDNLGNKIAYTYDSRGNQARDIGTPTIRAGQQR